MINGMPRPSVLMFAYFYPPCECWPTASARAEGLARGLAEHGWSPTVITRSNGCPCMDDSPAAWASEEERVQPHVTVRRTRVGASRLAQLQRSRVRVASKMATTLILLTEAKDDWPRRALHEGRVVFGEQTVDAIWTTSGPYRSIGVGRRLQRELGRPWVADLRDAVSREPSSNDGYGGLRVLGRRRWHPSLRNASAITCVSPEEAALDTTALKRRVEPIPSGFDSNAWASIRDEAEATGLDGSTFVIVYAGTLHRVHDPKIFLSGLRRFLDTGVPERSVSFVYLGHHTARVLAEAGKQGVGNVVVAKGRVPVREARLAMARANLLLLLASVNGESGIPGGKLYEYLAAGPPILVVPDTDDFVAGVLREAGSGHGASTPEQVADALLRSYRAWLDGDSAPRPLTDLAGFTWSARAKQLSGLLGEEAPILRGTA